ncbi:hypothetical protein H4O14_10840 [Bacillus sp. PAMC26568]|nr:hypothetical protein H4O14_10840 [Bacillus sp. PAMC26568]
MAKRNRGKTLLRMASRGRGTCPICGTKRIKLLYPNLQADGHKLSVCKKCREK